MLRTIAAICGLFMFGVVVFGLGTLTPDTTEGMALSWAVNALDDIKRERLLNSAEVQTLEAEKEELLLQLAAAREACPAEAPSLGGRLYEYARTLPFFGG